MSRNFLYHQSWNFPFLFFGDSRVAILGLFFNLGPIDAIFEGEEVLKWFGLNHHSCRAQKTEFIEGLTYMFHSKTKALQELPQLSHHFTQKMYNPLFGQPMGNVHASLWPYLVPYILLIPSDMYCITLHDYFTSPNCCFLNSHPGCWPNSRHPWSWLAFGKSLLNITLITVILKIMIIWIIQLLSKCLLYYIKNIF